MDVISENGHLFLGSRLKRLSDRFLTDAAKIAHSLGFVDLYPSQTVLIAALLQTPPISVTNLARNLGLSQPAVTRNLNILKAQGYIEFVRTKNDQRQRLVSLSNKGRELAKQLEQRLWGNIEDVVTQICNESSPDFVDHIEKLERILDIASFEERFKSYMKKPEIEEVEIVDFVDQLTQDFYDINKEWISDDFVMEEIDEYVLSNPRAAIIADGGAILLAKTRKLGVVGTCALMKASDDWFELTKMGVRKSARGLKIGEKLLVATLEKAKTMEITKLFLLTNKKNQAAIHLYEKLGFIHSQEVMDLFGHEYERCNVAMLYVG
jgi:DNA-binding MarR family transcriptional regulator/predicted GNAT family N-acyltransferase